MEGKKLAVLIILLIFVVPDLLQLTFIVSKSVLLDNPSETTQEITEIMVDALIPWWLPILEAFAELPEVLASIFTLIFLGLLYWIGEIGE